jgi:hypothetical protein
MTDLINHDVFNSGFLRFFPFRKDSAGGAAFLELVVPVEVVLVSDEICDSAPSCNFANLASHFFS